MSRPLLLILLFAIAASAHADGGRLQIRQTVGPFIVSLFTTPEALAVGPADVSVLVESAATPDAEAAHPDVLLDADVTLTLTPHAGGGASIRAHLTHAAATNRLLQAAAITLPAAGTWDATILVREGGREATATAPLVVEAHSARRGTLWFFALLPVVLVALYLSMQAPRRSVRG